MPPPTIYTSGAIDSPDEHHAELRDGVVSLPYATPREPAGPDHDEPFYSNERGMVLRLGIASVSATKPGGTTDRANEPLTLEVTRADELGVLPATRIPFAAPQLPADTAEAGPMDFAAAVDAALLEDRKPDVYVYVHGYKVVFENAIAVSTELWHYLDYEGAFIAFAWPSTPRRTAYFGDLETAETAAIMFRHFLSHLAADTQARRIHVIAYSAGTRVVTSALAGLALARSASPCTGCDRIGQVILIGSDMDRGLLGLQLSDGILEVVDSLTLYVSAKDRALRLARFLHGRDRAGEAFRKDQPPAAARAWLRDHQKLAIIDVTDVSDSTVEGGHRYFRKTPWVSSDLLMMLRFDLGPEARGLVRSDDAVMWRFPEDYIERLSRAVSMERAQSPVLQNGPR